ncbi:hypothetical protein Hanom_Chr13g01192491 [Helianthus anomalus]
MTSSPASPDAGDVCLKLYVISVGAFIDMCMELLYSTHLKFFVNGVLNLHHKNDFEHGGMLLTFFVFSIVALLSEKTRLVFIIHTLLFVINFLLNLFIYVNSLISCLVEMKRMMCLDVFGLKKEVGFELMKKTKDICRERVGRGRNTLDHVCVGKMMRRGLKTFFNKMSSKKQTVCRAKRLHSADIRGQKRFF